MKIIAVVNNKGGVGKTTSAVNLAAGIAAVGKRRGLLIDLDAQGSASLSLGLSRADLTPGTAEVILEGHPVRHRSRVWKSFRGQWRWRLLIWPYLSSRAVKWS
jgi:cellulose biosynthesis protein BcsQ